MKTYLTPEQLYKKDAVKKVKQLANQYKSSHRVIIVSDLGEQLLVSINSSACGFEQRKYGYDEVSLKAAEFFITTPVVSLSAKEGAPLSEVSL